MQSITENPCPKSQLPGIHISFRMCQAMNGVVGKLMVMAHRFEWTGSKIVEQELLEVLCDYSTGWKETVDNDDSHSRQ